MLIEFETRVRHEDFEVEEVQGFEPTGEGDHLFLWIEKRGLATTELIARLARRFGCKPRDFGFAGRKDARAVTRQWISVDTTACSTPEEKLRSPGVEDARVLRAARHPRKLRRSQHKGNRFRLVLRGLADASLPLVEERLGGAREGGIPNAFGRQRYGYRGLSHVLGRRLLAIDHEGYLRELVSEDQAPDTPAVARLRAAVHGRDEAAQRALAEHLEGLPRELRILAKQLARRPNDWKSGLRALPRSVPGIHLSALQSRVFDHVLAHRAVGLGTVERGDVLYLHDRGASFVVPIEASDAELTELQARADAFELSPSGPMPGRKLLAAAGEPGRREAEAFAALGVRPQDFRGLGLGLDQRGARRPLRVPVGELAWTREGEDLVLAFRLPRGSYATTLLAVLRHGEEAFLERLQSDPAEDR